MTNTASSRPMASAESCLIITGMHRSGTSLTAAFLKAAGVWLGDDLIGSAVGNPNGHYEHRAFVELQDQILKGAGIDPLGCPTRRTLDFSAEQTQKARSLVSRLSSRSQPFGWKDPRTTYFLNAWHQCLPTARYLFVYRRPEEVVDSLFRRGSDLALLHHPEWAIGLWQTYNQKLIDFARAHPSQCLFVHALTAATEPSKLLDAINERWGWGLCLPQKACFDPTQFQTRRVDQQDWMQIQTNHPEAQSLYAELQDWADHLGRPEPADQNYTETRLDQNTTSTPLGSYEDWLIKRQPQLAESKPVLPNDQVTERALVQGCFDRPMGKVHLSEPLGVVGWCAHPNQHIKALYVRMGGQRVLCHYGVRRADIKTLFKDWVDAEHSGFFAEIQPPIGLVRPSLEAHLENGEVLFWKAPRVLLIWPNWVVFRWLLTTVARFFNKPKTLFHRQATQAAHPPPQSARPHMLLCTHSLDRTGAPLHQFEVASQCVSTGLMDATVLSSADGPLASDYEAIGVPVVITHSPLRKVDHLRDYADVLNSLGGQLKLDAFDLVYANTLESFYIVDCADQWGVPALWNIHESQSWQTCFQDLPPAVAKQARRCFEKAHRVVFVSHKTQALFSSLNTQDNFITINNGIKLEGIEKSCLDWSRPEARTALGVSENEVCLLTVGAVCERKNQLELIEALRSLPEKLHTQVRCYVVGARPSLYSQQLAQQIEALPETLKDRVVMVDETSDMARFYRAADVFVCNSRFESYPRVILEAMAYGLPIVTTPVFGIQEQVRNNINGVFYEPGDVHALRQHLTRCIEDPQWREQLADQSRPTLDSLTTFEQMITAYQSLIEEARAESANASTRHLATGAQVRSSSSLRHEV